MKIALKRPFGRASFSREFFLGGTAVVLVAMAIFGVWLGRQIESNVVNRAAQIASIYVESILTAELHDWSGSEALPDERHKALDRIFVEGTLRNRVVGFKLWTADGHVAYAGDHALIGRKFALDGQLAAAFGGEVQSVIESQDSWREPDPKLTPGTRQLEIYVPLQTGSVGTVTAVAEFDLPMETLDSDIRTSQQRGWLMTALCALAIYALMYSRVRRASDTILDQQRALQDQLQQLRTALAENRLMRERLSEAGAKTTTLNEQFLNRIAADLHDGPAQELAYALLRFDDLAAQCSCCQSAGGTPPELGAIHSALRTSLEDLRAIAAGMGVPGVDELSLADTVRRAACDAKRQSGCSARTEIDDSLDMAPLAVKITVYRLIRESLANSWRHAHADEPEVRAWRENEYLVIEVADRGCGFDPAAALASGRLGLLFMRERVRLAGGIFEIVSAPGNGTTIRARIPITPE
jgi:hypothetical protein